jgi:hypothetical protein
MITELIGKDVKMWSPAGCGQQQDLPIREGFPKINALGTGHRCESQD